MSEFLLGLILGGVAGIIFFGGSGMSGEKKGVILAAMSLLDRHVDYLEEQERQGKVQYSETKLAKDLKELNELSKELNAKDGE